MKNDVEEGGSSPCKGKLPRLPDIFYNGNACVFWTHTFENRASGWLNPEFHGFFRELCLHACDRQSLLCPVYCLMPDHIHLLLIGIAATSRQRVGTAFLRQEIEHRLHPLRLQKQPHDHVLREKERLKGAFSNFVGYIRNNPVRAELVNEAGDWLYTGAIIPGYPRLNPNNREGDFWRIFWRIYAEKLEKGVERILPPDEDYFSKPEK